MLSYSGVRGPVSLALALVVTREEDFDEDLRTLVLFHAAILAVLTLLINGTTIGFLINKLGLARSSQS